MRNFSPRPRSPWLDVAAVVFVFALLLAPLGYLALEMMGGSGGFGGGGRIVASGGGGSSYGPSGGGSSFSTWKARQGREAGNPLVDGGPFGGGAAASGGGTAAPFSSSWRARATPDLSSGAPSYGASAPSYGGATGGGGAPFGSGIQSPEPSASYGGGGRSSRGSGGDWTAEAQQFAGQALALSRQLEQMNRDPVDRSLGELAPQTSGSEGAQTAANNGAMTNANPPLPGTPTVPIDDHLHWLLIAGLVWGAWRLTRG